MINSKINKSLAEQFMRDLRACQTAFYLGMSRKLIANPQPLTFTTLASQLPNFTSPHCISAVNCAIKLVELYSNVNHLTNVENK